MSSRFEEARSTIKKIDRKIVFLRPILDEEPLVVYPDVLVDVARKKGYTPLTESDGHHLATALWKERPQGTDCMYILSAENSVMKVCDGGPRTFEYMYVELKSSSSLVFVHA